MSRAARTGDDQAKATLPSRAGVRKKSEGGSVGTDHAYFHGDALTPEEGLGGAEVGPIRAAAHDDADQRAGRFQAVKMEIFLAGEKSLGMPDSG